MRELELTIVEEHIEHEATGRKPVEIDPQARPFAPQVFEKPFRVFGHGPIPDFVNSSALFAVLRMLIEPFAPIIIVCFRVLATIPPSGKRRTMSSRGG